MGNNVGNIYNENNLAQVRSTRNASDIFGNSTTNTSMVKLLKDDEIKPHLRAYNRD
jgi:hypothetical protein